MTTIKPPLDAEVIVSAVISRTELPGRSLAELGPGDCLETEPGVGHEPLVRLTVGATTVAFASITRSEGRLIATIIDYNRPELCGRKGDKWKLRKAKPPMA
jgi:flagellar motor switch/type III secretory pathway protein FliN